MSGFGFDSSDWQDEGLLCCILAVQGLIASTVTIIVKYFKRRKFGVTSYTKKAKIFAGLAVGVLTAFSGFYIYQVASYHFTVTKKDYKFQKLLTIGTYMFDELHEGNFDLNQCIYHEDIENIQSDVYDAFRYTYFEEVYFLDQHTVCIYEGALFDSMNGYIVTDGEKEYSQKYFKIGGYENLYSWRGETRPEYW